MAITSYSDISVLITNFSQLPTIYRWKYRYFILAARRWHSLLTMRKYQYILILFLACACGNSQQNPLLNSLDKHQTDLIHQKANDFPNHTQISIGIIKNGEVSFSGLKNENGNILWVSNHKNIFEIGSITKVFTSTLLAKLVLDNKLQLNDNIDQYIEIPLNGDAKISFVQLANHTSGLPRLPTNLDPTTTPENPYKDYGEEKLKSYLSNELKLSARHDGTYTYSNLGAGLLGYLLAEIEGIRFESLIQREIFSKYHMVNSTTDRPKVKNLLIKGLDEEGNEVPNWDLAALVGAGGVLSSTEDLSKFALAHYDSNNIELSLTRASTHTINYISDVGLGWEIIKRKSGDIWYKHNGRTGGYSSAIIIDVNNKNGIIILSNISAYSSQSSTIDDLSFELMKSIKNP
jgi:CubicO group peptidase (beta-lactamase class C family)